MSTTMVKKTMFMNEEYLRRALRIFNVKTEKEAINQALALAIGEDEIIKTHAEIGASGNIERVYK